MKNYKIIGISGGSGSGKSTIVNELKKKIKNFVIIPQDSYYKSAPHITNDNITDFNFDQPDAFDSELLYNHLKSLKEGKAIDMPQYDFINHKRTDSTIHIESYKIIIFEGIMVFENEKIRNLIDIKLYIDTPDDIRFIRRLERDINERGRTWESVIKQYVERVRPAHHEFIEPTKQYADLIIPEGGLNENALKFIISHINDITNSI